MSTQTVTIAAGVSYSLPNAANFYVLAGGSDTLIGGDNDTLTAATGGNTLIGHDKDVLTLNGGGNKITLHDSGSITVNDARTMDDGYNGSVTFGDAISVHSKNSIALNYTLNLGASDVVSINFAPSITVQAGGTGNTTTTNYTVNAGSADVLNFAGSGQSITLNAVAGDVLTTSGTNNTILIGNSAVANSSAATGGACSNGIVMSIGATASGTTFNGGLGTDTFSAGAGYNGGNKYIGSLGSYSELFSGAGNCVNYGGLSCRVSVDLNAGVGKGYDASGNLLWTDSYTTIEQAKAAKLDGSVLTGSDAFFCELKGSSGQTTYYGGAGGDRIIWGQDGTTGLLDGHGNDVAYLGGGVDDLYWRNQPTNSKGVSNFGVTAVGFNATQDDINLSEFATAGFAGVNRAFGGANDLANWVNVSLNNGDTTLYFDKTGSGNFSQVAVTLKSDNLFADFGVNDTSSAGAQQVVQQMYNTGHLVLNQTL